MPRFFCPTPLVTGATLDLPVGAARHVQVLRLQPGDTITLFNGGSSLDSDGEFEATITAMGRSQVQVRVGPYSPVAREAPRQVHLAVGMPANERMDWLIEKATELGVASIQPLMTERSVLRLSGERADKKVAHWQSIAVAACEQSGRNRVPPVFSVMGLAPWLASAKTPAAQLDAATAPLFYLLSLRLDARPLGSTLIDRLAATRSITFLSGPEGGLSLAEDAAAVAGGFVPVTLGPRVLRAETAALAALVALTLAP